MLKKIEALRVKKGDVLILRLTQHVPADVLQRTAQDFRDIADHSGLKIMLLDCGVEVAAVVEEAALKQVAG